MTQAEPILDAALNAFQSTTRLPVRVDTDRHQRHHRSGAFLQLKAGKRKYRFRIEVKTVDRFATPALIKARETAAHPTILVTPYVTRETAERCRELKLPFIDNAGNAYIEADGLFVYVVGQHRPVDPVRGKFRALTAAGLRLTFALLCRPDLLQKPYRDIARAARISLGTVGPAIKDLQNRGLLQRTPKGAPRIGNRRRLLDEWTARYATTLRPKLKARRFQADLKMLERADLKAHHAFWGGEPAADRLTRMLRPKEFTIYTAGPWMPLAAALRLRADPHGNLELLDAFWDFSLDDSHPDVAPPPLVYADLMATQDGRNIEVANVIYEQHIEPKLQPAR